jgi:hypothetical protein
MVNGTPTKAVPSQVDLTSTCLLNDVFGLLHTIVHFSPIAAEAGGEG